MLPHLNCIVVKDNRYHWCASIFWIGLDQHFSLIEVIPSKDRFSKVRGYDILMKMNKLKLITILSRKQILELYYEKKIKILPEFKMAITDKMMFEILIKETNVVCK
jgi:hypothetical protein